MLTDEELKLSVETKEWLKTNKTLLYDKFANLEIFEPAEKPTTIFMAGAPGAGKTEFSKSIDKELAERLGITTKAVRIDADEIKLLFPQYNGKNTAVVQSAAYKAVEKLHDFALTNNQNIIFDGTFSRHDIAHKNVSRSINRNREVGIFYIYQDPVRAWEFTKIREAIEGRPVPKDFFIDSFFSSIETVDKIKKEFGKSVILYLVEKDYHNRVTNTDFNIQSVDKHINKSYDSESLNKAIK